MKKIIFLFLLMGFSQAGVASGTTVGNGGFVLSCGSKTQILDHFEAEGRGLKIEPVKGHTLDEKVESLFQKLESIDPNRAESYRFQYSAYWKQNQQTLNVEGLHLNANEASNSKYQKQFGLGNVSIPQACELVLALQQIADENLYLGPQGIKTKVYTPVWKRLDLDTQAALVLHELFYREYLRFHINESDKTSKDVRFLNGLLGSTDFYKLSTSSWINQLKSSSFVAMFPNFAPIEKTDHNFDLEVGPQRIITTFDAKSDYVLSASARNQAKLVGEIELKGNVPVEVISNRFTKYFLDGFFPNEFYLTNASMIDVSAYAGTPLKLNVDINCNFKIERTLEINSIGVDNDFPGSSSCTSYLDYFSNEKIKYSGPIRAFFSRVMIGGIVFEGDVIVYGEFIPHLYLLKTEFSILQAQSKGKWIDANRIDINLKTGEVTVLD